MRVKIKKEYKLISETSKSNFENLLNKFTSQGYEIEGNIQVSGTNVRIYSILLYLVKG